MRHAEIFRQTHGKIEDRTQVAEGVRNEFPEKNVECLAASV